WLRTDRGAAKRTCSSATGAAIANGCPRPSGTGASSALTDAPSRCASRAASFTALPFPRASRASRAAPSPD
ncbi:MAG: hypothetical protein AVDCRST_MAG42-993, partial [uncultured Chthoniobacterales bacterium]